MSALPIFSLREWETRDFPAPALTDEDRKLIEQLGKLEHRLEVLELRQGLRVSARSWVGVVRFQGFEVHIVPKLAGENLGLVQLIEYATGLDALKNYQGRRELDAAGKSLLDLIAMLFAEAAESVVRRGLIADYRECEEDLPVVRGRILVDRQLIRRYGRADRVECRYDERVSDIAENQIVAAALLTSFHRVRHEPTRRRVRRLQAIFDDLCSPFGLDLDLLRRDLIFNRVNEHYRTALTLAGIILDLGGVREIFSSGPVRSFFFLLDMNLLFEQFLARWLGQLLRGLPFSIEYQRNDRSIVWDLDRNQPYQRVRPDLTVFPAGAHAPRLPIDAKYKLYDERKLASGDVYQSFLYAFACGEGAGCPPAALLFYPASSPAPAVARLEVRGRDGRRAARIQAHGIFIPAALAEARSRTRGPLGEEMIGLVRAGLPAA